MVPNQSFSDQVSVPGGLSPEELARTQGAYENVLSQSDSVSAMGRIPRSYAEALLEVAERRGQADGVGDDYRALTDELYPSTPGLEAYLDSPATNRGKKDGLILRLLDGKATPLFVDFLRVLNRKNRLGMLRFIGLAYRTLREERGKRIRVRVDTAAPLSDAQTDALRESLTATLGKAPLLVVREKPELIGGLVVHAGDKVYDTSVRSKLLSLRNQLLARGTHEIQQQRDRFGHP